MVRVCFSHYEAIDHMGWKMGDYSEIHPVMTEQWLQWLPNLVTISTCEKSGRNNCCGRPTVLLCRRDRTCQSWLAAKLTIHYLVWASSNRQIAIPLGEI